MAIVARQRSGARSMGSKGLTALEIHSPKSIRTSGNPRGLPLYLLHNQTHKAMLRFSDGVTIDTTGPLRTLTLPDGHYVVGNNMLIPVDTLEVAREMIQKMGG